jgi:hypothetical protein
MAAILSFIQFNQGVDWTAVITYMLICMAGFWLLVCVLTARDAYLRFGKWHWAIFWFFMILFLNLLGLIVYFLVRPDDYLPPSLEMALEGSDGKPMDPVGGLNIPIANFVGKEGDVIMSFQLRVNNIKLKEEVRDMRIEVDWDSQDPNKNLIRTTDGTGKSTTHQVEVKNVEKMEKPAVIKMDNAESISIPVVETAPIEMKTAEKLGARRPNLLQRLIAKIDKFVEEPKKAQEEDAKAEELKEEPKVAETKKEEATPTPAAELETAIAESEPESVEVKVKVEGVEELNLEEVVKEEPKEQKQDENKNSKESKETKDAKDSKETKILKEA